MPFQNPIAGGVNLVRKWIQSPNFVTGVAGWIIRKDGTAEFASAIFRGVVDVIGSSGAEITIDPQVYPIITFFSPDHSNSAFIEIVTGQAADKANLNIQSGDFTDVDGIPRKFIIQLDENNTAFRFVDLATGQTSGGMNRLLTHSAYFGVEDIVNLIGSYVEFRNDTALGSVNFRRTDGSDLTPVALRNQGVYIPQGILVNRKTSAGNASTNTIEIKDAMGDVTLQAYSGRTYEICFHARANLVTGSPGNVDVRIRGNNSNVSPTNASTLLAGSSLLLSVGGGGGATQTMTKQTLNCPGDIAAGLWTIAPFFVKTAGAATAVTLDQSTGQSRELTIHDVGRN